MFALNQIELHVVISATRTFKWKLAEMWDNSLFDSIMSDLINDLSTKINLGLPHFIF